MPNASLSIPANEIHVWTAATRLDDELERLLSEDERRRADQFKAEAPRRIFVFSRATLRLLLSRYLQSPPAAISFAYGSYGKPALAVVHNQRDLRFNISHAEDLCLLAVACGVEVGIDVERVRPMPDMAAIAEQYFSANDLQRWLTVPTGGRAEAFFQVWTRMEARCKAIGQGIGLLDDKPSASMLGNCSAWPLQVPTGYVGTVATTGVGITITQFDWPL